MPCISYFIGKVVREIDPTWSHGEAAGSKSKVKCNYCRRVINGGDCPIETTFGTCNGTSGKVS